jgi:hypothetical protein
MNKNAGKYLWIAGISTMMFLSFTFFSCKKDGETKGVILVNDSIGNPVEGAEVTLFQDTAVNPTTHQVANVHATKISDSDGRAEFVFALEAYLNIKAIKGNKTAKGFIRLKEHETVSQTVHF